MQRDILAVVVELLVALSLRTIDEFFPNRDLSVRDALAWIYALVTLALRNIEGHETTQAELQRRTRIPDATLRRYLERMRRDGLI